MNSPAGFHTGDATRMGFVLGRICADPVLHGRFLNTLSLLEHIGSRKIMASRAGDGASLSGETLKHLAEETRHAFFFKRAAEAVARRPLSYDAAQTLAGSEACFYMGRLDAFIARAVSPTQGAKPGRGTSRIAYLYMSLVIELRAVWFYELYQGVLKGAGSPLKLSGVLAEEGRHLADMRQRLTDMGEDVDARLPSFTAFEEQRFFVLFAALERAAALDAA